MNNVAYISEDLVKVKLDRGGKKEESLVLAWGDRIEVLGYSASQTQVRVLDRGPRPIPGTVHGKLPTQPTGVLQLAVVDVQQGDAMLLQTPQGRLLLIDGGDNKLFARYLANRFPGTSEQSPLLVEAMTVTHGDADHIAGLNDLVRSETDPRPGKAIFVHPRRVLHSGLVKGPSNLPPDKIFGVTLPTPTGRAVVELEEDLLAVNPTRLNKQFVSWVKSLRHWSKRGPTQFERLAFGNQSGFSFLKPEGITVDVYGPITEQVTYQGAQVDALPLLCEPPRAVQFSAAPRTGPFSTAQTINGHSVVLRLHYGNVRVLFAGDLNRQSMARLLAKVTPGDLQAEIVKVPHHGSSDFDIHALKAMGAVVWLISSGDESARTEYIHPRASLLGALGRASRTDDSMVFCTELAAFFEVRGYSLRAKQTKKKWVPAARKPYFGFARTVFGILHVRTDGQRVLVFTHSAKEQLKEAYRFTVDPQHNVQFAPIVTR